MLIWDQMGGGKKLLYLESLRGIAALIVVFTHFAGSFFPAAAGGGAFPQHSPIDLWLYQTPLAVLVGGNFSVCVFFVLSGFVLTRAFFVAGKLEILTKSASKRYFRLMPPVALSVLLVYGLMKLGLFFNHEAAALSGSKGLDELWNFVPHLKNALDQAFYGAFVEGTVGAAAYNPVLWTMQVEFLGSFLVFGLAALFGGRPGRRWMYVLLIAMTWRTYYLGFALGMLLADLMSQEAVQTKIAAWRGWRWAGIMLAGLLLGGYPSSGSTAETWYRLMPNLLGSPIEAIATYHTLGAVLVVAGVLGWARAQRFLEWRPFVALGRQSFGLYLTHLVIIATFSSYLFKSLVLSHGYRMSFLITFAVSVVVIFVVSALYTRWVDQPAIAFANWVVNRPVRPAKRETTERLPVATPLPVPAALKTEAD